MASQKLELELRGLYTAPNNLSGVPQGALEVADNVVINAKNRVDSRRGQTQYGSPLTVGAGQVNKLFNYASSLIASYASKLAYDSGDGAWVDYPGSYSDPATGYKMRSLEALRNFYVTTNIGVYKIDSLTATPRKSGVVKALGGTGALSGGSGFLLANTAVAYRMIWGYRDANNNLILGSPSQRLVVANTTGTDANVSLTFTIPATITTEYFYQIYRSQGTATATDEPTDELQLVIEGNPTTAEITAKSFTTIDATPYSLMRAFLYTSPSQEGIANSNDEPPYALDMDIFKGSAFYANVRQKQRLSIALISVGTPSLGYFVDATVGTSAGTGNLSTISSTAALRVGMRVIGSGIPVNAKITAITSGTTVTIDKNVPGTTSISVEFQDRFTIGLIDYWGGSSQILATNQFKVDTSGTPGQNIQATALNLIEVINKSTSNTTLYAYYLSGVDDLPGQMLFEERSIGGGAFYATSTEGSSFSPDLPERRLISAISLANPTVITTAAAHGLSSGDIIQIFDSNSTPIVDGEQTVTVLTSTTFSVPVHVTVAGTVGYFVTNDDYVVSDNDDRQNRVFISKPGQVEAVPGYTYFDIGSANFPIQKVVALRDGIFFFKNDGIYRLSGEVFANFTVALVDNTTILKSSESAVPFNNQVFCFTTQGVCAVTDAGVQIMSVQIENTLLELSSDQFTNFSTASFAVAYESARQYMFFTVTHEIDEVATQAFVFNSLTETWTRWVMDRTCGVVNTAVNKLFMAQADTGQILIERKSYTNADFADEQFPITITVVTSSTQVTVADASDIVVGMSIVQGLRNALIEDINGLVLTLTAVNGLIMGAANVYTPIENTIQWAPIDAQNPGILKQFSELSLFFRNAAFSEIDAIFASNISLGQQTVPLLNLSATGWGAAPWGGFAWGSPLGGQAVIRTYVPQEKQRCSWLFVALRTKQAFTGFSLQGVSLIFNVMSSRFR